MLKINIILPVPNTAARFHLHREAQDALARSQRFQVAGATI